MIEGIHERCPVSSYKPPHDLLIFIKTILDAYKRGSTSRQSAAAILLLLIEESGSRPPREIDELVRALADAVSGDSSECAEHLGADSLTSDFMVMRIATGQDNFKGTRPQRE
jgi:hypothetical protein